MNDYYVYVYIDPRNFEEFYYGQGKGSRKNVHLKDESGSVKAKRIKAIQKEGKKPIVRVIAAGLTKDEALLIEATLIWKLGKYTTNIVPGHFSNKFRPHDTYHVKLSGFDYQNGVYYYNVGDGKHRNWDDYVKYGFISAGQGARWRDAIIKFEKGDIVVAYLKSRGYVGVGRIIQPAKMIKNVEIDGIPLLALDLKCRYMSENSDDVEKSEYVARVEWIRTVPRNKAKWKPKSSLYTTTHVRASLDNQPETIAFVNREFEVDIRALIE